MNRNEGLGISFFFGSNSGCCPSESELQQLVTAMEGESTNHFVTIEKFVPVVCGILQQKR